MKHRIDIDMRGKQRDGETPLVCTPLVGRTRERLLAEAASVLAKKPDLVEWRVDFFGAVADTDAVIGTAKALRDRLGRVPLIFTRRAAAEGGQPVALDEPSAIRLYEAIAGQRLAEFVDYELGHDVPDVDRVRAFTRAHGVRLILSYHNTSYTPGRGTLVERFLEAERLGADVAMVQVTPRDVQDVLTLLAATAEADAKVRIPLIAIALGPLGAVTRMVGGLFGSALSFAVGESASAPGQIPIGDLTAVFDIIRRSRGGEML
jgi:3-dehydroquinate dehydratase-1